MGTSGLNRDELEKVYSSTVKYILHYAAKKIPIKSSDVAKCCLHNDNRLFSRVWPTITDTMSEIYGIRVNEVRDERGNRFYLCTSEMPCASVMERTVSERCQVRLLYLTLSYIFMKGGSVQENALWAYLDRLDIRPAQQDFFGDVKKAINETFIKQMYLKREKVDMDTGGEGDFKFHFCWSYRANLEFNKMDMLQSVADVLKKPVTAFPKQYQEASSQNKEEEEEMELDDD